LTESRELPSVAKVAAAVKQSRREQHCQVLLWQRSIRYGAVVMLAACAVVALRSEVARPSWIPIAVSAGLYVIFVSLLTLYLKITAADKLPTLLPVVVIAADIAMIVAMVYFSSQPNQFQRILMLGFLIFHFGVFYFGWESGAVAAVLTVAAYIGLTMFAPAYVDGPVPPQAQIAVNAAVFLFVAAILTVTFGDYRDRMDNLRQGLMRVGLNDFGLAYDADADRRPDDVTTLGRSFNEMRDRLADLIGTDPLTNCLNRRALEEALSKEWRQAKRRGASIALLAIDLDKFKEINDGHGHRAGDFVLRELGKIMLETARDTDHVARVGGDEFVILLPDTGWQGATTFAERLRRRVDDHAFRDGTLDLSITISVGVALARANDPVEPEHLMQEADRSLYRAKTEGRNRIVA
jgi:diguanylate cyclase (GGDEF)-like protein